MEWRNGASQNGHREFNDFFPGFGFGFSILDIYKCPFLATYPFHMENIQFVTIFYF
jgi:hypothetical protein